MKSQAERVMVDYEDGSHLAFSRNDHLQMEVTISEIVERSIERNKICLLFATKSEIEKLSEYLRQNIESFDSLVSSSEIVFDPIDDLLIQNEITSVTAMLSQKLESMWHLAKVKQRKGINVIGRVADSLTKEGKYEEGLLVEWFWQNLSKTSPWLSVICMYDTIPYELERALTEMHSYPLQLGEVWQITPANYKCARCKRPVQKEIRIHDPSMMDRQSMLVSIAMKQNDAGWIPFCFDCIKSHPVLRPSWLNVTKAEKAITGTTASSNE